MTASAPLSPIDPGLRAHFGWIDAPHIAKIIAALEAARPSSVRFVGGCVRDSLIGAPMQDIDLATVLRPDAVIAALRAAGLGASPTGIDHGTVTAIADHRGIEVTSLRTDVATDGRRATVAYTDDWAADAARRDFTINALYLTPDSQLYDPLDGAGDLAAGRVRFIGAPADRIREDYLRILRFFRFSARFARAGFDEAGLAACAAGRDGLKRLSPERIGQEICRLLALPDPIAALTAMDQSGVLPTVWPARADIPCAARMKALSADAGAPLMLAALWAERGEGLDTALRLSNVDGARRARAVRLAPTLIPALTRETIRLRIYDHGADGTRDAVLLATAAGHIDAAARAFAEGIITLDAPPPFPLKGRDVTDLGIPAGPSVGAILRAVEARWKAEDFPDTDRLAAILEEVVAAKA